MPPLPQLAIEDQLALASLRPKIRNFCREYLVDLNATQAAIRAGYSPHTASTKAHQLLALPDVKQAVQALIKKTY